MPRSQGQGQGRKDWEFEISKYKLLYIKLINNKFLLYSTENYIQYLAINHNGKKMKNVHIYIYREREIELNHFAVQQKLTQHYKSIIQ